MAGHLHLPDDFDNRNKHSAIVCVHPGSGVKKQTAGIYARKLAHERHVTLAYDASCQSDSCGGPRFSEKPAAVLAQAPATDLAPLMMMAPAIVDI
jgi:uncharacterized protein